MLKSSRSLAFVLAALGLAWTASTPEAQAQELRVATLAPDDSAWMKVLSRGAEEIRKATDGRVSIKYYSNGVQGDEKDVVRKLGLGQLDGAALTSVGLSLIDKSVRVLELPRLFKTEAELDYVRAKMWGRFQKRFEKKGYMLAPGGGDVGWIHLYTNTPIKSVGDLKKIKMWRWTEDGIVKQMFSKLGINGVPLGVPQVMAALNTGRINGCYASPIAAVALQWYTKVKYATSLPMSYGIGGSVLRKPVWDKISAKDRKVIEKILNVQARKLRRVVRKDNGRAMRAMSRAGVKVIDTPPGVVDAVDSAAKQIWSAGVGSFYPKGDLDKVLKHLAEKR
jgi:TRAP-type C4-dicarboxylate transport system substrate-binding protein